MHTVAVVTDTVLHLMPRNATDGDGGSVMGPTVVSTLTATFRTAAHNFSYGPSEVPQRDGVEGACLRLELPSGGRRSRRELHRAWAVASALGKALRQVAQSGG